MLRLALPKGSLEEQTLRLFEAADLTVRRGSSRAYHGAIDDARIERVSLMRPQEIPVYVQAGFFDLGVTGRDWLEETQADVEIVACLEYAKSGIGRGVRIVLAVAADDPAGTAAELAPGSRISTEYPGLACRCACFPRSAPRRRRFPRSWMRSWTSPRRDRRSGRTA
jgi:ATP phosphoribosyltransferase